MLQVGTYQPTDKYDPTNPNQVIREVYAYAPGGYSSVYFNRIPNTVQLRGLGMGFSSLPTWGQMALVGALSLGAGYFAMAKWGDRYIKPQLKKFGLAGSRRR